MSNHDEARFEEIAIVGMAGRFPGARDVEELWRNLRAGVESIRSFSDEEMLREHVSPEALAQPGAVKAGGVLDEVDRFDAEFFGISRREAEILDPQQRFFLECAWEALESAGHVPSCSRGSIGVFAGAGVNTYLLSNLFTRRELVEQIGGYQLLLASEKDYLATRVSYKLNLTGPSFTIQTACSTSLVAVHVACQSLLNGECDLALAGGVSISVPHRAPYVYQEGGILSPDGHCRAFDADARGTVPGNGVGIVVLKRLSDAIADRDRVVAVIKGSAINNDGSSKVGFTAPGVRGQTKVLREALAVARVDPDSIGYIECHGTGTPLGDPTELEALAAAYGGDGAAGGCAIGSVKTNIGHLDAAAGVTGLIKAALSVEHGVVVPTIHFRTPNPRFDFERSPFHVSSALAPWPRHKGRRRAAVSSFGIGGTNAHVILEEAPASARDAGVPPAEAGSHKDQLLPVSARTPEALARSLERVAGAIEADASLVLADVAYTLQTGREAFACRQTVVAGDRDEAIAGLRAAAAAPGPAHRSPGVGPELVFMFPGQGTQYVQMGADLYRDLPTFRTDIDACAELLRAPLGGDDIRRLLWPPGGAATARAGELHQTQYTQPATFVIEYALARLWMSWGVVPQALVGHSVGEYVAACLAGVFTLSDALALIAARGRLVQSLPAGAMLAVFMSEDNLDARLPAGVTIAAVNGRTQCVVAGRMEAVAAFERALVTQGVACKALQTSHAFHSPMMDPILAAFGTELGRVTLRAPAIRCLSNLTGTWLTDRDATDPGYWIRHLRETVRFGDCLETLRDYGASAASVERVLVEVGPGRTLSQLARRAFEGSAPPTIVASMRDATDTRTDIAAVMSALGRMWTSGVTVDWDQVHAPYQRPRRVALPTYPFERRRYWIEPATATGNLGPAEAGPHAEGAGSHDIQDVGAGFSRPVVVDGPHPPHGTQFENPTEAGLAGIWRELIGADEIEPGSNFFELGGDSLLLMTLASRIARVFGVTLPMRELFEAPTLDQMAAVVARHVRSASPQRPPVVPVSREGALPLSYAQQRLWFLEQFEPGTAVYNEPAAVRMTGRLDVAALEESFADLIARHESLRTSFQTVDGRPIQTIAARAPFAIECVDLKHVPAADRLGEARARAEAEARRPFDLGSAPLLRLLLVRLAHEDHLLVVTMHHIVSDAWSMRVMVAELAELYRGRTAGAPGLLPPLAVQPLDVTVWQQRWLEGGELDRQLDYWRRQLSGPLPLLELPTDRPHSSSPTSAGDTFSWQLDAELAAGLQALGRREGVTLFMTLLALYQTLLFRLSGQHDVCVGSPVAARSAQGMEHMVGFFVNSLVLRVPLDGAASFRQLLARVRDVTLDAFANQDIPFEKLVEHLQPNRDASRAPLFQTMFALQTAPAPVDLPGLSLALTEIDVPIAKFELTFEVTEHEAGLLASFEYSTDLFDRATIARFATLFDLLAQHAVAQPDLALAALPNMSDEEKGQLAAWSTTGAPAPWQGGVVEAFRACVARDPDHTAVEQGELALSYAELDRRAARLARRLRALGVGADVLVGIHLSRTPDLIVALLGVLQAGGAYVPLDPGYPAERLALIVADARPRVVLTSRSLRDLLPAGVATIIALDEPDDDDVAGDGARAELPGPRPEDLAYVIYTSGTTGQPKGVQIPHAALANYAEAASAIFELTPGDRVLQFSSISFDTSVEEIFCTLTRGATLVLRTDEMIDSVPSFLMACEQARISVIDLPTAYWHTLTSQIDEEIVQSLGGARLVIIGGEQALAPAVARWLRIVGGRIRLLNTYGPTETTIAATIADLTAHARRYPGDAGPVPIGHPTPGLRAHVLDGAYQQVPVGVTGELFVGGIGLARGYLGDAALTEKRFVRDPFAEVPDARMYRTGDLVRYRADGRLEYVGRADQQVKIRGYRVELGDVEAAIGRHPRVLENVVIAREDTPGDRRLVAYVVFAAGAAPSLGEIREHLAGKLPEYMVPSAVVALEAFPLTVNGKLDRKALPAPASVETLRTTAYDAPQSQTEQLLAGIWVEVLRVARVGLHDDFFELGGHSLLVMILAARIARVFAVKPPVRELFEAPTLERMATVVARHASSGAAQRPPIVRVSREGALPLSYAQQRLWFLEQFEPGTALYNIPAAVRMTGRLDIAALEGSFADLVTRHESLRTSFHAVDGRPIQMIAARVSFAIERVDLSHVAAADRLIAGRARAEAEARRPFDMASAPLLRVVLVRLSDEDHLLVLTMHHIVSDGWSLDVMVAELGELYRGHTTGAPALLPPLAVQPLDVTVWQQRWLEGGELDRQLDYWRRQLSGPLPLLELPTDRPHSSSPTSAGDTFSWQLDAEVAAGLRALGRGEGVTLFMTLLALYQTLLFRLSGQHDVCVGSPVSTRSDQAMEHMVGFFVNSLVLRVPLDGAASFRQLLARVRDVTLDAFANQDIPFEKLVEHLQPNRDASRTPLFQTMFSLQNASLGPVDLPGVSLALAEMDVPIAKLELTFEVTEHEAGLLASFEYSTDLFDRATIARFATLFDLLAQHAVAQPDLALAALPNMSDEEKGQLAAWSTTGAPAPWQGGVVEAFRACVARDPDHTAVEQGELALSYAELDRRAARLARRLRALGVGPDVLVGIHLLRTPDLIVALLGVLQAGGAYVPLDPGYPAERIALMLADAQPRVVLTSGSLRDALPASTVTIALDEPDDHVVPEECPGSLPCARPEDLAYVIYTSGTTGRPKGVQIPHAALANYAEAASAIFELTPGDRVLQFSSVSFDTSVEEIFCTLTRGATLVLRTDEMIDSIPAFVTACERASVSVVGVPTAYWHTLTSQIDEQVVESLHRVRLVIIGGEQALAPAVARWSRAVGGRIRLLNAYGPTETTISATIADLTAHARLYPHDEGPAPIGHPVPGLRTYVLDEAYQRVPLGVTGELFVGGIGLARGYLGDAALTEKRFVRDPLAAAPDARMYRTGDLVRYRADGRLEYVGRADQQVKIRGYRVELGDVEAAIGRHPRVLENVVIAREDTPGDRRLVAYVVPKEEATLTLDELKVVLGGSLPEYMHPAALVVLPRLPLSPSGKVDRRALPAPLSAGAPGPEMVPPRSDLESALVALFAQVLGLEQVGVTDDFFNLGGHSLLATQLLSRINSALGLELSLRQLFAASTVERLAIVIEDMLLDELEDAGPPLVENQA